MPSNPLLLSAREIAAQIRCKKVSPVEVARAHLDRIERLNPKLNAFVDYQPEVVLAQARHAEKAILRGDHLGPLHGVPVSIKSSMDVAGHLCEAGSRLRAGYIAAADAPLVGIVVAGMHGGGDDESVVGQGKRQIGMASRAAAIAVRDDDQRKAAATRRALQAPRSGSGRAGWWVVEWPRSGTTRPREWARRPHRALRRSGSPRGAWFEGLSRPRMSARPQSAPGAGSARDEPISWTRTPECRFTQNPGDSCSMCETAHRPDRRLEEIDDGLYRTP